tara:strand:- start:25142 stop:26419 length:1278 start_codon:yes stop_codon:yes gene_type:complete
MNNFNYKIAILGLGYVGLPLSVEFAKKYFVTGFDINKKRVNELKNGIDITKEVESSKLISLIKSSVLNFTSNINDIVNHNIYIITVPTPVDKFKNPDLSLLIKATEMVSSLIKKDDIIIYESTVYPGCTEEVCIPIIEKISRLKFNTDFYCGYSPERINPGDKINTLSKIKKVVSGSTPEAAKKINQLYSSIITAGTHLAPSIKVAEASKAIENAQRDINISFVNELALIFDKMEIDTNDVLEAAGTKWNFLKYKPGLVGGHCIGVDPYYLAYKSKLLGYTPEVILSGRKVNDNMGLFVADKVASLVNSQFGINSENNVLILGFTFKENCSDFRNTKSVDIFHRLKEYGFDVDIYDPWANSENVKNVFDINLNKNIKENKYDAIVLVVAHKCFLEINFEKLLKNKNGIIFDCKSFLPKKIITARL